MKDIYFPFLGKRIRDLFSKETARFQHDEELSRTSSKSVKKGRILALEKNNKEKKKGDVDRVSLVVKLLVFFRTVRHFTELIIFQHMFLFAKMKQFGSLNMERWLVARYLLFYLPRPNKQEVGWF